MAAVCVACASVGGWAFAGARQTSTCCCPDPETCKCHHDNEPESSQLARCNGSVELGAPILATAAITGAIELVESPRRAARASYATPPSPIALIAEPPEPPPF